VERDRAGREGAIQVGVGSVVPGRQEHGSRRVSRVGGGVARRRSLARQERPTTSPLLNAFVYPIPGHAAIEVRARGVDKGSWPGSRGCRKVRIRLFGAVRRRCW
jgi:hypothetical protein